MKKKKLKCLMSFVKLMKKQQKPTISNSFRVGTIEIINKP